MGDFTNIKRVNTPFIKCKIILIFVHTNDEKKTNNHYVINF